MPVPSTMKAAVLSEPGKMSIETIPVPNVGPYDVLIEVKACGICGSDILGFHGQHPRINYPRVLGHEFSGVVAAIGSDVKHVVGNDLKLGDRVAGGVHIRCGKCWACRHEISNHCEAGKDIGLSVNGGMAQYVLEPVENVFKLPPNVNFIHGALAETLAVGYHAARLIAKVGAGDIVVIIGAGPVGMNVLLAAKASGAYIVISDMYKGRLDIAKKAGATRTVLAGEEDLKTIVKEISHGRGADKVFETVGGAGGGTLRLAVEVTRPCGTLVIMGNNSKNSIDLPITTFKESEITMIGSRGIPADCLERALLILAQGEINLDLAYTNTVPLRDVNRGFEMFENQKDSVLKVVLDQFDQF
ncbi:MAG: alcohol dehydrogenase catalytic domain-containing protein [Spirochaetaceae bacterium]|nr:alcohol dehydrogenase catalytic domain-containing protein [Spirochaetaceae bacterium]